jgi:cytochrome b561
MIPARYPARARIVHWAMAALILSMIGLGLMMVDSLAIWRTTGLWLHKLGGLLVLTLAILRFALRFTYKAPPLPNHIPALQRHIASASHVALYGLMFLVPVVGLLMQNAAGVPIILPLGVVLPPILPQDLPLYGVLRLTHGVLAWALLGLIALHVAAALHHTWVRRDGLLKRMM